jgi:lysophospholipase L1-like esterase
LTLLKKKYTEHELLNHGKGGDTVISLLKRLKSLSFEAPFDITFLWIGVNDVLVKTSRTYPIIKFLRGQPWAKSHADFRRHYQNLLLFLLPKTNRLFTVTPLFIGEDLNNPWNRELEELGKIIEDLSTGQASCRSINIRKSFIPKIDQDSVSPYIPRSFFSRLRDVSFFKTSKLIEKESERQRYCLTFDGIHLNGAGAALVAETFSKAIEVIK